ncbi:MAG: hypothetical protein NTY53_13580 [Kiritimatiellaeota bacterium]|nr:hypothetical protein [Kiritimatiellota bacterium]
MKLMLVMVLLAGCAMAGDSTPGLFISTNADHAAREAARSKAVPVRVKPLTAQQQEHLLKERISGGLGYTFHAFANMFLVSSRQQTAFSVGLMSTNSDIVKKELQAIFPQFYKPTLRELLDAIALQTAATWSYEVTGKFVEGDSTNTPPLEGFAIFEFVSAKRAKPFEVTLAKGWKAEDRGHWLTLVPPTFPVGLDIYEIGAYSAVDPAQEKALFKKVPAEVALEWAQRVKKNATRKELKPGKVGPYDAWFFEAMVPTHLGQDAHWRHWVFMVANKCYFIVSTIFPEREAELYPAVEQMLKSFKITKPKSD